MKTAAEVCRDIVKYSENLSSVHAEFSVILTHAKAAVKAAEESGELDRILEDGELVYTGLHFRGHQILLEVTHNHAGAVREGVLRKQFANCMDRL